MKKHQFLRTSSTVEPSDFGVKKCKGFGKSTSGDVSFERKGRWISSRELESVKKKCKRDIKPLLESLSKLIEKTKDGSTANFLKSMRNTALQFDLSSEEQLNEGEAKKVILKLTNLERESGIKLEKNSKEKDLLVRLLFILSGFSRAQEWIISYQKKIEEIAEHQKKEYLKSHKPESPKLRSPRSVKSEESAQISASKLLKFNSLRGKTEIKEFSVSSTPPSLLKNLNSITSPDLGRRSPPFKLNLNSPESSPDLGRRRGERRGTMSDVRSVLMGSPGSHSFKNSEEFTSTLPLLTRSKSMERLEKALSGEQIVVCRICEEEISLNLLKEHSKFCVIANKWDMIAAAEDEQLAKAAHLINERINEVTSNISSEDSSPQTKERVDTSFLLHLKKIAQRASEANFAECIKLLLKLRESKDGRNEDIESELERVISEKIDALRNAEEAVMMSPRLLRTESPRLLTPRSSFKPASTTPDKGIPSMKNFQLVKQITHGAFGSVYLAKKLRTNDLYAIKAIKKSDTIQKNHVRHVAAERNILAQTQHDFVVKMYYSFQSVDYLFLVMEYANGGDLFSLLYEQGALSEELARMYVAETVLALEYIHSLGIVHRDLKPDNLLIDHSGHIKLTDFGLSSVGFIDDLMSAMPKSRKSMEIKQNSKEKRKLFSGVGTPDYLAPEILLGIGHSYPVDWWALGVVLFELLCGCPPFAGDNVQQVFQNVLGLSISWDELISPLAKDLISSLLKFKPEERLDAAGVKAHPFFKDINWNQIRTQTPPYIPPELDPESTENFSARENVFNLKGLEESVLIDNADIHNDITFGSFWYVNFENLQEKNMNLFNDLCKDQPRERGNSF
eukprot:TRINITY_DN1683_c1_g1_i5.p1 TRINITY_DN1683_c1_g1~~TRINITY_DN1683_c1_g1_i5.p1  ORF type:complete len:848 (+),score=314.15 TRINITY_DN1683_c1_g1_i5:765-3308(+)